MAAAALTGTLTKVQLVAALTHHNRLETIGETRS